MSAKIEKAGFECEFDFDSMSEEECQTAAAIIHEMWELAEDLVEEFAEKNNRGYKLRRL
jgi:hypothetical protein